MIARAFLKSPKILLLDEVRRKRREKREKKREKERERESDDDDDNDDDFLLLTFLLFLLLLLPFSKQKSPPPFQATSALDAHSEDKITQALAALLQGRTSVVVAHRLQTVKRADAIAVVSCGRVAERWTHEELVAAKGIYAGLVSSSLI